MTEVETTRAAAARQLHQRITVSAQLVQQNLWDLCCAIKQMRDDKLYKELGYDTFEGYCINELGISRKQAYQYISIAENVNEKNVTPGLQIGVKKLSLLAKLTEEQQSEIAKKTELESISCRKLEEEIKKLKAENQTLVNEKSVITQKVVDMQEDYNCLIAENQQLSQENRHLKDTPPAGYDNRTEREIIKQVNLELGLMEDRHAQEVRDLREGFRKEKADLETQLKAAKTSGNTAEIKTAAEFESWLAQAEHALNQTLKYAYCSESYKSKLKTLLYRFSDLTENLKGGK